MWSAPIPSNGVWVRVRLIENSLMVFFVSFARRLANRRMKRMCSDVNECLLLHPYTLLQLGSITNDKSRKCQRLNNERGRAGNWEREKTRCNMFSSLSTCGEQRNKSHAFTSNGIPSYDRCEHFFLSFSADNRRRTILAVVCVSLNVPICSSSQPIINFCAIFRLKSNFALYLSCMKWKIACFVVNLKSIQHRNSTHSLRLIDRATAKA